jgi:hypothetical protein
MQAGAENPSLREDPSAMRQDDKLLGKDAAGGS